MGSDEPVSPATRVERFFDAPNVDYAAGVASAVSALATSGGYIYAAIYHPTEASAALVVAGMLALVLSAAIALLSISHSQKIRKIRRLSTTIDRMKVESETTVKNHVVSSENLNVIFSEFAKGLAEGNVRRGAHFGVFVNRVKAIFDRNSTSGKCAVCIKLLKFDHALPEFDGPYLWTAKRDDISSIARSKIDHQPRLRRYAPDENKAFSDIMSRQQGKDHFACNDLRAMGESYFNSNVRWPEFYNAVLVVPIKPCREEASQSTVGFLCVDSLDGIFSEDVAVPTLLLIAEILYRHIRNFPDSDDQEHPTG